MNNQHAGLSQELAEQRITDRLEGGHPCAAAAAGSPVAPPQAVGARRWWQLARWPAIATDQPVRRPPQRLLMDRRQSMSKRTRALVLGVTLAAMNLAGLTAVAHAQANHDPDGKDARRLATERQVGESWRHHQVAPESQTTTDPSAQRALARQRYWYYQSMLTWRRQTAHEQTAADAALQRVLARERFAIPSQTPDQPTTPAPPEPSRQPSWLLASLGGLVVGLALAGGLAVLAARRAGRRARIRHAS
jgi:hypothetical protein